MIYYIDIDGTICTITAGDYSKAQPIQKRIDAFNVFFDLGNTIIYYTARGATSGIDWRELTEKQLKEWGVKYTELKMGKPHYDFWIDDKATNPKDLDKYMLDIDTEGV